jgi:RimJ/RimL family protein N-acetyltransferase
VRIEPFVLRGEVVQLEPLGQHHVTALTEAANADRATFGYTAVPDTGPAMARYVDALLDDAARGLAVPFVQRRLSDDAPVGCTRLMNLVWTAGRELPSECEIGGTWLATSAQRSAINTEAKLVLLRHAFEVWGVHRVAICTDERNARSRAAIERLGARFEGVLRNHRLAAGHHTDAGTPRNTACYSILPDEWPQIRDRLVERLGRGHHEGDGA